MPESGAADGRREPRVGAFEVVVAGGGIAGLEALLALRHLAGARVSLTLISAEGEFSYRPMAVEEPFSHIPATRHDLAAIASELGARLVRGRVAGVEPNARTIALDDGQTIAYDAALLCVGAQRRESFSSATTFAGRGRSVDRLLVSAAEHPSHRIGFIVPPGVSWSMPAYELALLATRRASELGLDDLESVIVTPEAEPLIMFGPIASHSVYELLRARGISFLPAAYAEEGADGEIVLSPGGHLLEAGAIIALPTLHGPAIEGVPRDSDDFIPIDEHGRVPGCEDLYAAGDATSFPIKQGGLGAQQADAAAEQIAAGLGIVAEPEPFHPVLRGKLITGEESLNLRADAAGGDGDGVASDDYLWWPPHKVAARYLGPWLARGTPPADLEPPRRPIDVEVALPTGWHREPMALDPYASLSGAY